MIKAANSRTAISSRIIKRFVMPISSQQHLRVVDFAAAVQAGRQIVQRVPEWVEPAFSERYSSRTAAS
jgi:hypothetical protein